MLDSLIPGLVQALSDRNVDLVNKILRQVDDFVFLTLGTAVEIRRHTFKSSIYKVVCQTMCCCRNKPSGGS